MFHALVHGRVGGGAEFDVTMEDIEALNERAADPARQLDVTKLSIAAWTRLSEDYEVLGAGAALGRGCGPLVVSADALGETPQLEALAGRRVAIPGLQTTAYALLRMFGPSIEAVPMRFDAIMPAVLRGECDAGLVIHESRFTYREQGLRLVADLGEVWEAQTGLPLPLGVIVGHRRLSDAQRAAVEDGLRASVEAAWADPAASRDYIRTHAQEIDEEVCRQHIELYVNRFSAALGEEGRAAIEAFRARVQG